eukprot:m.1587379 g.1587379  ORF g.1587379 m.1587379 type:complete len:870 (+) comp25329_c0_seq21:2567-5176(+)
MDLSNNLVHAVPADIFVNATALATFYISSTFSLNLAENPVTYISTNAFQSLSNPKFNFNKELVMDLVLNLSYLAAPDTRMGQFPDVNTTTQRPTSAVLPTSTSGTPGGNHPHLAYGPASTFTFAGPLFQSMSSSVTLLVSASGVSPGIVNALRSFDGNLTVDLSYNNISEIEALQPMSSATGRLMALNISHNKLSSAVGLYNVDIALDLSFNQIPFLPSYAFGNNLEVLYVSNNEITALANNSFNYSFALETLDLSANNLTYISASFLDNVPTLKVLVVTNNQIRALPSRSNHIATPSSAAGNVLKCAQYGPQTMGCSCDSHGPYPVLSTLCGYERCTATTTGCENHTFFNSTDCALQPWSTCVASRPPGEYYSTLQQVFQPISDCSTSFKRLDGSNASTAADIGTNTTNGTYLKAYQFAAPTNVSDRQCSICSTCPADFNTVPCTATTNTVCRKQDKLGMGDIAAIALSVVLLGAVAAIAVVFGRAQRRKRAKAQENLEMTEELLGSVEREKDRVVEENERMQQAWTIEEGDLKFAGVIGQGAFGTVYKGVWGHIPVAIKVLRMPIDDLDPMMTEDFNQEVTFMQTIRHPNLLIFYGAGIDKDSRAFLVTELMAGGSLRKMLLDQTKDMPWAMRLVFATDAAKGMRYLHEKKTLHRDLKSDNCFVSEDMRVKVADFGTGKIQSSFHGASADGETGSVDLLPLPTAADLTASMRTGSLTSGTGSPLWMSPEALQGLRVPVRDAWALDVYSYAIVLWELWGRGQPWNEIEAEGIEFFEKLTELVVSGVRPALPPTAGVAPSGYHDLMQACWASKPTDRLPFTTIVARLEQISATVAAESKKQKGRKKTVRLQPALKDTDAIPLMQPNTYE